MFFFDIKNIILLLKYKMYKYLAEMLFTARLYHFQIPLRGPKCPKILLFSPPKLHLAEV